MTLFLNFVCYILKYFEYHTLLHTRSHLLQYELLFLFLKFFFTYYLVLCFKYSKLRFIIILRNIIYYKSYEVHNASSNRTLSVVMGHYARTLGLDRILKIHKERLRRTPMDPMVTEMDTNIYPVWWGLYGFSLVKGIAVLLVKYGDVFVPLVFFLGVILLNAFVQKKGENAGLGPIFDEGAEDYPVYMARVDEIGYDATGRESGSDEIDEVVADFHAKVGW